MKPATAIAVLPFVNMTSDAEKEYLSDGITEEIINALAAIDHLKVTSRTSSFYFKGKSVTIQQIAGELGVSVVLEGSVRVAGDTIRITAQLIQARDDFHYWSETWDRKLKNIFEVQDEISLIIAEKIREQFGHFEIEDHLVKKPTQSIEAYEYALKAKHLFNQWNPEDAKEAIGLYYKALDLDMDYAEACVGLADAYGFLGTTQFMPPEEAWSKASEYTQKALKLDPDNAGAHYQLANLSFFNECDYTQAVAHTRRSIELKPNYPEARQFMSLLQLLAGNLKESEIQLKRALEIDPLSPETRFFQAYFHYRSNDYTRALELVEKLLEQNPKNIPANITRCNILLKLGRPDEVISLLDNMPDEIVVPGDQLGLYCLAYLEKKDEAGLKPYLEQFEKEVSDPAAYQLHAYQFHIHAMRGEFDAAFAWLDRCMAIKSAIILLNFSDPLSEALHGDPRYAQNLKKLYPQETVARSKKTKKVLLDKETCSRYEKELLAFMEEEEPYLNPSLSLRSLGEQVDIHPNQLSWLLNEKMGKNFNEFINHYRIETFKKLALDPGNAHISLIGLAYESGFNSKTVFNTHFKKTTGMTPKEFVGENKKS